MRNVEATSRTEDLPRTIESSPDLITPRFRDSSRKKSTGSSYTPEPLARFVAKALVSRLKDASTKKIRALDPAVGDGELLVRLVHELTNAGTTSIQVQGYDTDSVALEVARRRLSDLGSICNLEIDLRNVSFLDHALSQQHSSGQQHLFSSGAQELRADVLIANPPYVRTQVMGAAAAQALADRFGLTGRVDLYHAFILAIASHLGEGALAGLIVSNRFMTTRGGAGVRECLLKHYELQEVWDLGDTKIFEEAVLPAVVIARRASHPRSNDGVPFTKVYSTSTAGEASTALNVLDALETGVTGHVDVGATRYEITSGTLDHGADAPDVWRVSTADVDGWLDTILKKQHCEFRDLGKIRVGVKTTADKIFIRENWDELPPALRPEDDVLRALLTHREIERWRPCPNKVGPKILYTHKIAGGKRVPIELHDYPRAAEYLESNRGALEARTYVRAAGRRWYEIWVPQDPAAWQRPKLVFRDIAEESQFAVDTEGRIVNGDCYWLSPDSAVHSDLLWLALAVGNSSFILEYYDHRFANKLYAGRRRFMSQYVERFPIPPPDSVESRRLVDIAKKLHAISGVTSLKARTALEAEADDLVWRAFGLQSKKSAGRGI